MPWAYVWTVSSHARGGADEAVTREVDLGEVRDLLERVPRACIAVAGDDGPRALPIRLVRREGRYLAGIRDEDAGGRPGSDQEAVVLVDEGVHYFELRAVYVPGRREPAEAPAGAPAGRTWFEVLPVRAVAWDYGKLREVSDGG